MGLLPSVLPGIKVTHADRQVALLRDVLEATAATEAALLRNGFPAAVVDGVVRLSRFDAGWPYLGHLRAVAASRDLSAMRAAMANLLLEEKLDPAPLGPPPGAVGDWPFRREALRSCAAASTAGRRRRRRRATPGPAAGRARPPRR
jgi:hypothetical protein